MKTKSSTKQKTGNGIKRITVSRSLHQLRAEATYREMKSELTTLKQDVSFREYVGYEMCIKKFAERYEKWLKNCR